LSRTFAKTRTDGENDDSASDPTYDTLDRTLQEYGHEHCPAFVVPEKIRFTQRLTPTKITGR
jgi:hypothetical protein